MTLRESIIQKLEDSGYRITGSRVKLVDSLIKHEEGFTAEELVSEVREAGRATVYRTIRLLVDQGVLCKLAMDSGAPRYTVSGMAHHHHLICVHCGSVREFRQTVIERALKGMEDDNGDTVVGHRIEVFVLCATCKASGTKVDSIRAEQHHHT